jgi:5-methylcytosine-specific restriction endonuclease McrA
VRSALQRRDPVCAVPGCCVRDRLEIHHVVPFAIGGPTTLENLVRICSHHHSRITNDGAELVRDESGGWAWRGPP